MIELSLARASQTDFAVVIASFSGRLSRMYKWDLATNTFEAGQFVKARARVLDVSPDGKYVAYFAEKHGVGAEAYISVSHPPYFSALACFLDHYRHWHDARFISHKGLCVGVWDTHGHWSHAFPEAGRRIDPGCPFTITVKPFDEQPTERTAFVDEKRNRKFWADGLSICASDLDDKELHTLFTFRRDEFQAIEPPDWAKVW